MICVLNCMYAILQLKTSSHQGKKSSSRLKFIPLTYSSLAPASWSLHHIKDLGSWSIAFFYTLSKECSNYCTIALISHASKVMLKILQARLQQYVNCELPDVQVGFRKGRGTKDQIANICRIIKKVRVLEKHLFLLY